eukprot:TRINITY_DN2757_c0_g1_i3.p1 TRINITY_DN2757_c0_g1~~TRINITY_DN2757_c0_g1_i3.p1  ORF type:complete len:457 (+),score=99.68 TRINITY_DN2757_c0_g1_i3:167-1537(+)
MFTEDSCQEPPDEESSQDSIQNQTDLKRVMLRNSQILSKLGEISQLLENSNSTLEDPSWYGISSGVTQLEEKILSIEKFYQFIKATKTSITSSLYYGYFCVLPPELIIHLFVFLDLQALGRCHSVCKLWSKLAADDQIFKQMCIKYNYNQMRKPEYKTWKWVCECHKIVFKDNKNGCGTFVFPEEGTYFGQWKDNKRSGYGVHRWNDGSMYEGQWEDDNRSGLGKMTWADGQCYDGMWKNGRKEGKGIEVWSDGRKYVGDYVASNMHGTGTYTWPGGDFYVGEWRNDNIHGHGAYTWNNGSVYDGEWAFDEHTGFGTYTCPSGESYQGHWQGNLRHGIGKEKWFNGTEYCGEWRDNRKHGKGVFTWPDGDTFRGEWIEGKRSKGVLISNDVVYIQNWSAASWIAHDEMDKRMSIATMIAKKSDFPDDQEWSFELLNNLKRKQESQDDSSSKRQKQE